MFTLAFYRFPPFNHHVTLLIFARLLITQPNEHNIPTYNITPRNRTTPIKQTTTNGIDNNSEQGSKEHKHEHRQPEVEEKIFTDEELTSLIDPILTMDDYTRDGFIDYPEFVRAQQKAAQANADSNQQHQPNP